MSKSLRRTPDGHEPPRFSLWSRGEAEDATFPAFVVDVEVCCGADVAVSGETSITVIDRNDAVAHSITDLSSGPAGCVLAPEEAPPADFYKILVGAASPARIAGAYTAKWSGGAELRESFLCDTVTASEQPQAFALEAWLIHVVPTLGAALAVCVSRGSAERFAQAMPAPSGYIFLDEWCRVDHYTFSPGLHGQLEAIPAQMQVCAERARLPEDAVLLMRPSAKPEWAECHPAASEQTASGTIFFAMARR